MVVKSIYLLKDGALMKPIILGIVVLSCVYVLSQIFGFEFSIFEFSGVITIVLYYVVRFVYSRHKRQKNEL